MDARKRISYGAECTPLGIRRHGHEPAGDYHVVSASWRRRGRNNQEESAEATEQPWHTYSRPPDRLLDERQDTPEAFHVKSIWLR